MWFFYILSYNPKTSCPSNFNYKNLYRHNNCCLSVNWGEDSSVGRAPDWKARHNTDARSSPQCSKGFFSQSQLSLKTLLRCPYSPCVQLHASCYTAIPLFGHKNIPHTPTGMGSPALAAAVPYPCKVTQVRRPKFPVRDNEVLEQTTTHTHAHTQKGPTHRSLHTFYRTASWLQQLMEAEEERRRKLHERTQIA